ncbi:MAG: hypothetical protein KJ601_01055 [Nanoarchaeota archaeon]|nr:hypothetical protein [Nanoarchaeota archaeon]
MGLTKFFTDVSVYNIFWCVVLMIILVYLLLKIFVLQGSIDLSITPI